MYSQKQIKKGGKKILTCRRTPEETDGSASSKISKKVAKGESNFTSYSSTVLFEEPRDIDIIIKTEHAEESSSAVVNLPCPPKLQHYTAHEIYSSFEHCYGLKKSSICVAKQTSLFGQVFTHLTSVKNSSLCEREYLLRLWMIKYKPPSLHKFTEEDIGSAFYLCYNMKSKLDYNSQTSLFGKVFTFLTENKRSTVVERRYLYDVWRINYKDILAKKRGENQKASKQCRAKLYKRKRKQEKEILEATAQQHVDMVESSNIEKGGTPAEPLSAINSEIYPNETITIKVKLEVSSGESEDDEMDYSDVAQSSPPESCCIDKSEVRMEDDDELNSKQVIQLAPSQPCKLMHSDQDSCETNSVLPVSRKSTTVTVVTRRQVHLPKIAKRDRGKPRLHFPRRIKKLKRKDSEMQKLINNYLWAVPTVHDDKVPLPAELFHESHARHMITVSGELLTKSNCSAELLDKTSPTVGKGTFANPCWTLVKGNKAYMCVCPGCGLTFKEVNSLLRHRDEKHREYLGGCVICSKPIKVRGGVARHLATHMSPVELQALYEKEMNRLGPPPIGPSIYRLYKCDTCSKVFVGSKNLEVHIDYVHKRTKKRIRRKNQPKPAKITASTTKSVQCDCTICGQPLEQEYMALHMRTHFNFEEQKEFVKERREKMKLNAENANKIQDKKDNGTDVRIEQLKKSLCALEKNNPKNAINPRSIARIFGIKKSKKSLRNYTKRDGNYGPVQCSICGQIIATIYTLRKHEIIKHEGGLKKLIPCSICGRPFGQKQSVSTHFRTHFNLEEKKKFAVWPGSVLEFIERLNNGTNLEMPPTRVNKSRKADSPFYRIRNKPGRPRKHHHLYEKQNADDGVTKDGRFGGKSINTEKQVEFSDGGFPCVDSSRSTTGSSEVGYNRDREIGSTFTSAETLAANVHPIASQSQWNTYTNQVMSFFPQNNI